MASPSPSMEAAKAERDRLARQWSETSVRWLMTHHKAYVATVSKKTWQERLQQALIKMGYKEVEHVDRKGHSRKDYIELVQSLAMIWSEDYHNEMVKFLEAGGHETEHRAYEEERAKAKWEKVPVADGEDICIELDGDGSMLDELEAELHPRSQISAQRELDEILEEATAQADPRYKVW